MQKLEVINNILTNQHLLKHLVNFSLNAFGYKRCTHLNTSLVNDLWFCHKE